MDIVNISIIELVNSLDYNKIEKILKNQGIKTIDENYLDEFEYRQKFEFKKYLLGKYLNWKLPFNFISLVDKMEYILISDELLNKKLGLLYSSIIRI